MTKVSLNNKGFAPLLLLVGVAAVLVLGGGGAYVYHKNHKPKAPVAVTTTSTKTSTQTSKSTTPTVTNPYAGWQTAGLKYEQATFRYPATWQITNTSKDEAETGGVATPGADSVTLTSPTGLIVSMRTGLPYAVDETGMANVLSGAQPIQTLGGSYYLDFYTNTASGSNDAQAACLDTSATTNNEAPYIVSKNIQLTGTTTNPAADLVCVQYDDAQGEAVAKPVSTFEQDASYNDAKLVIESLTY